MSKLLGLFVFIVLLSLFASACVPGGQSINVKILPVDCAVDVSGQVALSLSGQIPAGMQITWSSTSGNVVWTGQGLTATFLAPAEPGVSTITVAFISGTPSPYSSSRDCMVTNGGPGSAPGQPVNPPDPSPYTVVLSEVMANTCGGKDYKKYNQYVELYNYGNQPVDVYGWFFFDEGGPGAPDQIVSWATRSSVVLEDSLVANSTIIPPGGFALILSPQYPYGIQPYRMPYVIPPGTIILTIASSDTLGDDYFGIIAAENGSDTLTLYRGSLTIMDQIIDTYGTPIIKGPHPNDGDINDDFLDHVPLYLSVCHSAERVDPRRPDAESNWVSVEGGTPGDGPYP